MEATTAAEAAEGKAVVRVLAAVLERLVVANAPLACADAGPVTKFHALKAPSIGVLQYLERIHKYASCSTECFILALIYIDRLIQRNNFLLTELNVHRVVISAILLAAKFFDDAYYNNAYYAKVGGVLVSEMNGLEVEFLFRINFSLFVTPEVFYKYHAELVSHALAGQQPVPPPIPPATVVAPPQHAMVAAAAAAPQHTMVTSAPAQHPMVVAAPQHTLVAAAQQTLVAATQPQTQHHTVPLTESVTDYQHALTNFPMPVSVIPTAPTTDTHHPHHRLEHHHHALAMNAPQITPSPPPPTFSVIVPHVAPAAAAHPPPPSAPEEYAHATDGLNQAFDNILSAQVIPSINAQLLVLQGHQAAAVAAAPPPMGTNHNFCAGRRLSLQLPSAPSTTLSPSSMSCAEQLLAVDPMLANANVYFSPRDLVIAHQAVDASGYRARGL